jgi:squalene-hopene/tetraprenyl-beta-curcumene cyclase
MSNAVSRLTWALVAAVGLAACSHPAPPPAGMWDARGAASYLDRRMAWWESWRGSARDHGTFCFSCHTAVPYSMARPALGNMLGEEEATTDERRMLEDVRKRVRLWHTVDPFYFDAPPAHGATGAPTGPGKTAESRGTESVLSALVLAWEDARTGAGQLSSDTRIALENMWGEQLTRGEGRGAWAWLNFRLAPWEVVESQYYGAALAALAVGVAPGAYASEPKIQDQLALLKDYLRREYRAQPLHQRLLLLWAAERIPDLLDSDERRALITQVLQVQNPDGGWSLSKLMAGCCSERTLLENGDSDGYATGLVTLVLEQQGDSAIGSQVERGRLWLMNNQSGHGGLWMRGAEEFWVSRSLNKERNLSSNIGRFMSDAATAYAVLALTATPGTTR